MLRREFAVIGGKRRNEIELSGGDLVWVVFPESPEINQSFCFLKNIIFEENTDFIELELVDGTDVKIPLKRLAGLEVVAHKDTRQYDLLAETLFENHSLKTRLKKIEKNFSTLLEIK